MCKQPLCSSSRAVASSAILMVHNAGFHQEQTPFPLPPSLSLYKWSLTKFLCPKNPSTNSYSQFFSRPTVPVLPQLQLFKLSMLPTPQHLLEEILSLLPGSSHSLSSMFLAPGTHLHPFGQPVADLLSSQIPNSCLS